MLDWFRTDADTAEDRPEEGAPAERAAPARREEPAPTGDARPAPTGSEPRSHVGQRPTGVQPDVQPPVEPQPHPEQGPGARQPGDVPEPHPPADRERPADVPQPERPVRRPEPAPEERAARPDPGEPTARPEAEPEGRTAEPEPEPVATQARIVCVANQKGGVGKTTTTVSLAAALAEAGAQVLLVDLDPQGNATTGLGLRPQEGAPSTYRVLIEEMPVEDATEPTSVRGLHCLPSSLDLAGAEIELVSVFNRERRLSQGLEAVRDLYDVILIDCPPTLGLLTVNALAAADQVILPIQCEYYALEGVGQLTRTVDLVRRGLNPDLELGGVVLTMYDGRTKLSEQVADEVRSHFTGTVFRTIIPRTVRLSEAPSYGQPITVYDPSSRGARAYVRLADELARRLDLGLETRSPLDDLLGVADGSGDDGVAVEDSDHDEEQWA